MRQDMSFHDGNRTGELISRLSTDVVIVSKSLTNNVSDGIRALVMSSVGLSAMCYVNLSLTLTMLMIVPPVSLGAVYYGKYLRRISKKTTDESAKLTRLAEEKISNLRTVRAFAQEPKEIENYHDQANEVFKYGMKEAYASGIFFGMAGLSGNLIILAILHYGGTMVHDGLITVGDLTSFFLYTAYVGTSVMGLSNWYAEMNKGVGASSRLFALLAAESEIESSCIYFIITAGLKPSKIIGDIRFENGISHLTSVSFAYPSRNDAPIFKNLSFKIKHGQNVAFVGGSGSGKSTIGQLILRFYDPLKGSIFIDEFNLNTLDPSWMRQHHIGIVSQEPTLFAASIKDNIRYGRPSATDKEVLEASKLANVDSFIKQFPNGYDTFAGERGTALSGTLIFEIIGGQKQRIAIAR